MLDSTHHRRWGQRVVAGMLLVLYAMLFASPLAATSPEPSMGRMACCRPGRKCCCHRKAPANAILSDKACGGQCGQSAAAAKLALELVLAAPSAASQQHSSSAPVVVAAPSFTPCHAAYSLRQRPPPAVA